MVLWGCIFYRGKVPYHGIRTMVEFSYHGLGLYFYHGKYHGTHTMVEFTYHGILGLNFYHGKMHAMVPLPW